MDSEQAEKEAKEGGLVGKGCEDHEGKVKAREERLIRKRKNAKEGRKDRKESGKQRKIGNNDEKEDEGEGWNAVIHGEEADEEERFAAGLTA